MIQAKQILPVALMLIDIGAAIVYAKCGDWRHTGYWIAAASITFFATF